MAAKSELLMMLVRSSGEAIPAECQAGLNPSDVLMKYSDAVFKSFAPGKYFQIEDFSFVVGLGGRESEETPDPAKAAKTGGPQVDKYARWRHQGAGGGGSTEYQLDVEPVSFTRLMDQASPVLFQACCQSTTLQSGTIVRRMAVGDGSGPMAYVRFDFQDVLITELDWDEGEQIKEKYKFVCRGVKMQFRPQNSDGTLGAAVSGVWPKVGKK